MTFEKLTKGFHDGGLTEPEYVKQATRPGTAGNLLVSREHAALAKARESWVNQAPGNMRKLAAFVHIRAIYLMLCAAMGEETEFSQADHLLLTNLATHAEYAFQYIGAELRHPPMENPDVEVEIITLTPISTGTARYEVSFSSPDQEERYHKKQMSYQELIDTLPKSMHTLARDMYPGDEFSLTSTMELVSYQIYRVA